MYFPKIFSDANCTDTIFKKSKNGRSRFDNITFESRNMKRVNFTDIDLNVFLNERNEVHVFFLDCHKHVLLRFYDLMYSDFIHAEPEETEFDGSICLIICYHMSLGLL